MYRNISKKSQLQHWASRQVGRFDFRDAQEFYLTLEPRPPSGRAHRDSVYQALIQVCVQTSIGPRGSTLTGWFCFSRNKQARVEARSARRHSVSP